MAEPTNSLMGAVADAYMRNIGRPTAQVVGNSMRALLGLDPADYADSLGMEAYPPPKIPQSSRNRPKT